MKPSVLNRRTTSVQGVTALGVAGWNDIRRIDVRPGRGMARAWLQSGPVCGCSGIPFLLSGDAGGRTPIILRR